ncbi:MAG: SIS domain-containing protein [Minicystis sp.]
MSTLFFEAGGAAREEHAPGVAARTEGAAEKGRGTAPRAARTERIFEASSSAAQFARGYLDYVASLLAAIDEQAIEQVAQALLRARAEDRAIFILGNGGSAATAGHFANDLAVGVRPRERPFRAQSLADNVAVVSAIANDYGYEAVFSKQLESRLRPGDVVVAISVSGNSPNVVSAVRYANAHGAVTIGLTAGDGGALRSLVRIALHVPSERGEHGPAEDVHVVFEHILTNYLRLLLARRDAP